MKTNNDFNFWVPLEDNQYLEKAAKTQKGEDKRYENMYLAGLASNNAKDSEGEVLEPSGYDLSRFLKYGFINFEHKSKNDPKFIIGEPVEGKVINDEFHVKGKLYRDSELARNLWDTVLMMKGSGATRKLGWSIEGRATERNPMDPKRITKALITGIALTFQPVNINSFAEICKGSQKEDFVDYEYDNEVMLQKAEISNNLYEFQINDKHYVITKSFQMEEVKKSEDTAQQAKIKKVMKEFKNGTLKSSSGELVTDRDQALAIAMSEAGMEKAMDIAATRPLAPESLDKKPKVLDVNIKKAILNGIIPIEKFQKLI